MTVHTNEEIVSALKVISDVCKHMENCAECPLGNDSDECSLDHEVPSLWDINDPDKTIWRALA